MVPHLTNGLGTMSGSEPITRSSPTITTGRTSPFTRIELLTMTGTSQGSWEELGEAIQWTGLLWNMFLAGNGNWFCEDPRIPRQQVQSSGTLHLRSDRSRGPRRKTGRCFPHGHRGLRDVHTGPRSGKAR